MSHVEQFSHQWKTAFKKDLQITVMAESIRICEASAELLDDLLDVDVLLSFEETDCVFSEAPVAFEIDEVLHDAVSALVANSPHCVNAKVFGDAALVQILSAKLIEPFQEYLKNFSCKTRLWSMQMSHGIGYVAKE